MSEGEASGEGVERFQSVIILVTAARKVVDSATVQGEQAAVPSRGRMDTSGKRVRTGSNDPGLRLHWPRRS
jgi:hypothetical protein